MPNDPFRELVSVVKGQMNSHINQSLLGVPCVLGTMTSTGVILDDFKHEIQDPLYLQPLVDLEIEGSWNVPAHNESGKITLPSIPTNDGSSTVGADYDVTFKFSKWESGSGITATKIKVKYKPEYSPGDRVLCVLVNQGNDVVIISKVVN